MAGFYSIELHKFGDDDIVKLMDQIWTYSARSLVAAIFFFAAGCALQEIAPTTTASSIRTASDVSSDEDSAARLHDSMLVLDAHADIEYADAPSRYALPSGVSRVAPEKLQAGKVDAVVMAVAVGPGPRDAEGYTAARATADKKLQEVAALVSNPANKMVLATSADAVAQAADSGNTAVILGFQNARILGTQVSAIDEFYEGGVRVFALTHMGHNDFADSSRPVYRAETSSYEVNEEHGGLSPLGKEAIQRINELGAVVDVSQLSKAATLQVLELTESPVVATHSNVKALCDVRRNLSDEEIDQIAANNGVIHVAAFGGYLFDSDDQEMHQEIVAARRVAGLPDKYDYPYELYWELDDATVQSTYINAIRGILGPGSIDALLNHVDYIVERVGVDHVGIGNDFNHGGGIAGFNDAGDAQNITQGLLERGYSEQDIAKIWGGNFLRVFAAATARSAQ